MPNNVWLTWEHQERNHGLAKRFDCHFELIDFNSKPRVVRMLLSTLRTLQVIRSQPWDKVFAQSPSLMLAGVLAASKKLFGSNFDLILDLHNSSVEALESKNTIKRLLARFSVKNANYVLVSNEGLKENLRAYNDNILILPDSLPATLEEMSSDKEKYQDGKTFEVVVIASYAKDEPLSEIFSAIEEVAFPIKAQVTGSKNRAGTLLKYASEKIEFTGFLPKDDYHHLLIDSDLIIDLTTRENCLVCGAYEALAAGTPAILSDSRANRSLFSNGMVLCANNSSSIASALTLAFEQIDQLNAELRDYKPEFKERWNTLFREVKSQLAKTS